MNKSSQRLFQIKIMMIQDFFEAKRLRLKMLSTSNLIRLFSKDIHYYHDHTSGWVTKKKPVTGGNHEHSKILLTNHHQNYLSICKSSISSSYFEYCSIWDCDWGTDVPLSYSLIKSYVNPRFILYLDWDLFL